MKDGLFFDFSVPYNRVTLILRSTLKVAIFNTYS